jgi:sigma-B regulation protein RsbU (phosphoserine phosphatase)
MALGAVEDTTWSQSTVCLDPGNTLVLYTDGITEAQNQQGDFFGRQHLLSILQSEAAAPKSHSRTAPHIQETLLAEIHRFMEMIPLQDDMTLMILVRDL